MKALKKESREYCGRCKSIYMRDRGGGVWLAASSANNGSCRYFLLLLLDADHRSCLNTYTCGQRRIRDRAETREHEDERRRCAVQPQPARAPSAGVHTRLSGRRPAPHQAWSGGAGPGRPSVPFQPVANPAWVVAGVQWSSTRSTPDSAGIHPADAKQA